MRHNLRRRHPDASDGEIRRMLVAWLHERPGAEHGDGAGPSRSCPTCSRSRSWRETIARGRRTAPDALALLDAADQTEIDDVGGLLRLIHDRDYGRGRDLEGDLDRLPAERS